MTEHALNFKLCHRFNKLYFDKIFKQIKQFREFPIPRNICVFVFHKAVSKKLVFLNKHVLFCSFMGQAETGKFYQTCKKYVIQNKTSLTVWITTNCGKF